MVPINVADELETGGRLRSGDNRGSPFTAIAEIEGLFRTRSQKCSYGSITRVYEFFICVERPGIPENPNNRPRSAHFFPVVT